MKKYFLAPNRPVATCMEVDCSGCPVQGEVHCHFTGRDLLRVLLIAFPPFITGGIGIVQVNAWLLLPWIGMIIGFFGFLEIRVMCSHCPHYAEPATKTLQCWANYGSPKLWKYRPGPMDTGEKFLFLSGIGLVAAYPLAFLVFSANWLLLVVFTAFVLVMGVSMRYGACCRIQEIRSLRNRLGDFFERRGEFRGQVVRNFKVQGPCWADFGPNIGKIAPQMAKTRVEVQAPGRVRPGLPLGGDQIGAANVSGCRQWRSCGLAN